MDAEDLSLGKPSVLEMQTQRWCTRLLHFCLLSFFRPWKSILNPFTHFYLCTWSSCKALPSLTAPTALNCILRMLQSDGCQMQIWSKSSSVDSSTYFFLYLEYGLALHWDSWGNTYSHRSVKNYVHEEFSMVIIYEDHRTGCSEK